MAVPIDFIPTGSLAIDAAIGIGGFPRGRVVEVFGPESSGKTTLALHGHRQRAEAGGVAAFIDAEHALDPSMPRSSASTSTTLLVSQPDNGEQALEICEMLVRSNAVDVVVVDSVAALVPRAEIEGEMGDSHVGLQARLMSQALRKLTAIVAKSKTTLIFINQIREKIGVMFGSPETTTGGRALKFYSSSGSTSAASADQGRRERSAAAPRRRSSRTRSRRPSARPSSTSTTARASPARASSSTWASRTSSSRRAAPGSTTATSGSARGARTRSSSCAPRRPRSASDEASNCFAGVLASRSGGLDPGAGCGRRPGRRAGAASARREGFGLDLPGPAADPDRRPGGSPRLPAPRGLPVRRREPVRAHHDPVRPHPGDRAAARSRSRQTRALPPVGHGGRDDGVPGDSLGLAHLDGARPRSRSACCSSSDAACGAGHSPADALAGLPRARAVGSGASRYPATPPAIASVGGSRRAVALLHLVHRDGQAAPGSACAVAGPTSPGAGCAPRGWPPKAGYRARPGRRSNGRSRAPARTSATPPGWTGVRARPARSARRPRTAARDGAAGRPPAPPLPARSTGRPDAARSTRSRSDRRPTRCRAPRRPPDDRPPARKR
jgi:hypothetical protein